MFGQTILEKFSQSTPIPVMLQSVLHFALPADYLDSFFEQHAKLQYTRKLSFSLICEVIVQVCLRHQPSVLAAYRRLTDHLTTKPAISCLYDKLAHTEPSLCGHLLADSASRLRAVFEHFADALTPEPIANLRLLTVDGNYLAATDRRLAGLPEFASPLPGMSIALREHRTGMLIRLACREDAYTNERALSDELLTWLGPKDVLVGDRNYCTTAIISGLQQRNCRFILRQHANLSVQEKSQLQSLGVSEAGEVFEQQLSINIATKQQPVELSCRRVVLRLNKPTRDGEKEVAILTDLTREQASGQVVVGVYGERWEIETCWQEMTEVLRCEVKSIAYPKAGLLCFTVAAMAYNLMRVIKAAIGQVHGQQKVEEELSSYRMGQEVERITGGMLEVVEEQQWEQFERATAKQMAQWLLELASRIDFKRYKKAKQYLKKRPKKRANKKPGQTHCSTARVLAERAQRNRPARP